MTTIKCCTSEAPVAVIVPGNEEKEDGEEHADERDEEAPGKADVLLHGCHSYICYQSSGVDKPVVPVNDTMNKVTESGVNRYKAQ